MRRKILLLSLLTVLLAACSGNSEPAEGGAGDENPSPIELTATSNPQALFEGSWFTDELVLDIFLPPDGDFIFRYVAEFTDNCGGDVFRAEGTVEVTGPNTITLTGISTCDSNDEEGDFSLELTYDPEENVLRDASGNFWVRS